MKVNQLSSPPRTGTEGKMSPVVLKRTEPPHPEMNLPSAKIQHETPPSPLIKKIGRSDYENLAFMHRMELERLLKMAVPFRERGIPHFSAEKGRMMDIFA